MSWDPLGPQVSLYELGYLGVLGALVVLTMPCQPSEALDHCSPGGSGVLGLLETPGSLGVLASHKCSLLISVDSAVLYKMRIETHN